MRRGVSFLFSLVVATAGAPVRAEPNCVKSDFEAVVDQAAQSLRDLTAQKKPAFQDKLRRLKDKRGWSHDQFVSEGAKFVQDDEIGRFDQTSNQLLEQIASGGEAGAQAPTPDCQMLDKLKATMQLLVDTQSAKWSYMGSKLDAELAK